MNIRCPGCNGIVYDRTNYVCASCGAELPVALLFLPPAMAEEYSKQNDVPIEFLAQTLRALRKARGNFQATREVVINYFKDGIAAGLQAGPLTHWLFSWPTRPDSAFAQVGYSSKQIQEFLEILKEKRSASESGVPESQTPRT
jgi:DNA-directed RNA polymerase subunit RPC12/RpoP